ncbi:hypothetical protein [Tunturiibacter gelidiferens]|uniref:hypothetical protein n=1 Tax=Tunturiibacter gelidiferens TaxID=3069689 RepID=UPI003D9B5FDA
MCEVRGAGRCCATDVCSFSPAAGINSGPPVQRNLQTLGVLWCVFGAYRIIGGLMGMFFLRAFAFRNFGGFDWPFNNHSGLEHSWMTALFPMIAAYTVVMAALAALVGYSLLMRRPWGGRSLSLSEF